MTDTADVQWIVDPIGSYDPMRGMEIVAWLDAWGKPFYPSSRYSMIIGSKNGCIWAGYKFHIGLTCEEDADEFVAKFGGFKAPGAVVNNQFVTYPPDAWNIFHGIKPVKRLVMFSPEHDAAYGSFAKFMAP